MLYEIVTTILYIVNYLPLELPGAMHGYLSITKKASILEFSTPKFLTFQLLLMEAF